MSSPRRGPEPDPRGGTGGEASWGQVVAGVLAAAVSIVCWATLAVTGDERSSPPASGPGWFARFFDRVAATPSLPMFADGEVRPSVREQPEVTAAALAAAAQVRALRARDDADLARRIDAADTPQRSALGADLGAGVGSGESQVDGTLEEQVRRLAGTVPQPASVLAVPGVYVAYGYDRGAAATLQNSPGPGRGVRLPRLTSVTSVAEVAALEEKALAEQVPGVCSWSYTPTTELDTPRDAPGAGPAGVGPAVVGQRAVSGPVAVRVRSAGVLRTGGCGHWYRIQEGFDPAHAQVLWDGTWLVGVDLWGGGTWTATRGSGCRYGFASAAQLLDPASVPLRGHASGEQVRAFLGTIVPADPKGSGSGDQPRSPGANGAATGPLLPVVRIPADAAAFVSSGCGAWLPS